MIELPFAIPDASGVMSRLHDKADVRNARLLLRRARWLIATPTTWCKAHYATAGAIFRGVLPGSTEATNWCALGATYRIGGYLLGTAADTPGLIARAALDDAAMELYGDQMLANVPSVNDNLGHAAVMRCYTLADDLLLQAIAEARS